MTTTPDDSSDGGAEDLDGVPLVDSATDGNSLESLLTYLWMSSSLGNEPAGGIGKRTAAGPPPPPPEMNCPTGATTMTSSCNLVGGRSDAMRTPRAPELSGVSESSSFDDAPPSSPAVKVDEVPGGNDTPEDSTASVNGNDTLEDSMASVNGDFSYPPSAEIDRVASTTTASASEVAKTFDVAQTICRAIKDTWVSGKRIPVVSNLVDAAEAAAAELLHCVVALASGGSGVRTSREMVLLDIDERVVKPQMKMLDEAIVSPMIRGVLRVVELVAMKADKMVIGHIARGPLGALFINGNEKKRRQIRLD